MMESLTTMSSPHTAREILDFRSADVSCIMLSDIVTQ
jgi:hypothetical protein